MATGDVLDHQARFRDALLDRLLDAERGLVERSMAVGKETVGEEEGARLCK